MSTSTVTSTQSATRLSSSDAVIVTRGEAGDVRDDEVVPGLTLQVTDDESMAAQQRSRWTRKLLEDGEYRGRKVQLTYGLAVIQTDRGRRVLLPPLLWAVVFKELHGAVCGGYLRETHTYNRVAEVY